MSKSRTGAVALIGLTLLGTAACNGSSTPKASASSAGPTSAAVSAPASTAPASTAPASTAPAGTAAETSAAAQAASGSGHKCSDLSNAAASAAVGEATTVVPDTSGKAFAGLTFCDVTVAGEADPVELDVNTNTGAESFAADQSVTSSSKPLGGVGDQAFTSTIGVEALAKGADIKVVGPAGPVADGNFTVPTALAKAMVAALG